MEILIVGGNDHHEFSWNVLTNVCREMCFLLGTLSILVVIIIAKPLTNCNETALGSDSQHLWSAILLSW